MDETRITGPCGQGACFTNMLSVLTIVAPLVIIGRAGTKQGKGIAGLALFGIDLYLNGDSSSEHLCLRQRPGARHDLCATTYVSMSDRPARSRRIKCLGSDWGDPVNLEGHSRTWAICISLRVPECALSSDIELSSGGSFNVALGYVERVKTEREGAVG